MKKQFEVTVRYTGSIRYTVEAENEDAAKKKAEEAFDEESAANLEAEVDNVEFEDITELEEEPEPVLPKMSPYERTRAAVYATGNRWAIENFEATHN